MQSYLRSVLIAFQCFIENSSPCSQSSPKAKEVGCSSKCFSVRRKKAEKKLLTFLLRAEIIKFTRLKKHMDVPCSQNCSLNCCSACGTD